MFNILNSADSVNLVAHLVGGADLKAPSKYFELKFTNTQEWLCFLEWLPENPS